MKHLDTFSGIGGWALASRMMGWETVAFCERDKFCQKVLRKNFGQEIEIYDDITTFSAKPFRGRIDILTGSTPCQPFSQAGKREGSDDDRHLFSEFLRVVVECQPRWIVIENVFGLLNIESGRVFEEYCSQLESENYAVQTVFQLAPSTRRTVEIGCGLSPDFESSELTTGLIKTPSAMDASTTGIKKNQKFDNSGTLSQEMESGFIMLRTPDANMDRGKRSKANLQKRLEKGAPLNLNDQLDAMEYGLLPTPTAGRATQELSESQMNRDSWNVAQTIEAVGKLLPTPQARDWKGAQGRAKDGVMDLPATVAKLIPTPAARDYRSSDNNPDSKRFSQKTKLNTIIATQTDSTDGKKTGLRLQPAFVEWMQGFPIGWTDLDR